MASETAMLVCNEVLNAPFLWPRLSVSCARGFSLHSPSGARASESGCGRGFHTIRRAEVARFPLRCHVARLTEIHHRVLLMLLMKYF